MVQQSIAWGEPVGKVRHSDPDTSIMAADRVRVSESEKRILKVLGSASDGMTAEEIASASKLPQGTVSTRMRRLLVLEQVHHKMVPVDDPKPDKPLFVPRTRETSTGSLARVYFAGPVPKISIDK